MTVAQVEIVELGGQDRLDVLRVLRHNNFGTHHRLLESGHVGAILLEKQVASVVDTFTGLLLLSKRIPNVEPFDSVRYLVQDLLRPKLPVQPLSLDVVGYNVADN